MQTAPGDPDCSATGSKHPSGSVPLGDALGSASLLPPAVCTPAVHRFCLSHALPGTGCFLVHSWHFVVCISVNTVDCIDSSVLTGYVYLLWRNDNLCPRLCVCMYMICAHVCVPLCASRCLRRILDVILHHHPPCSLSQGLSLNLEPQGASCYCRRLCWGYRYSQCLDLSLWMLGCELSFSCLRCKPSQPLNHRPALWD